VVDDPSFSTAKVIAPASNSVRSTSQVSSPAATATVVADDEESVPASPPQDTTNGESAPRNRTAVDGRDSTEELRSGGRDTGEVRG
jgi:hypothetical protein